MTQGEITADHFRNLLATGQEASEAIYFLATFYGVARPAIRSRLRRAGILPSCKPRRQSVHPQNIGAIPGDEIIARRVNRDPCPRCGSRRDKGCKHRPTAHLSNVVFA